MTFTLLHNAEAYEREKDFIDPMGIFIRSGECFSWRPIPSPDGFKKAYIQAMEINPDAVRTLFLNSVGKIFIDDTYHDLDLTCPAKWKL